jgi:hypothetical protein
MKTRRISKQQQEEILQKPLTDIQRSFIKSLIVYQKKFPQLSQKQWETFKSIYNQHVQRTD